MNQSLTIVLPLPRKALHPNSRCHYMAKARAKSEDRHDAAIAATAAMNEAKMSPPRWASAAVEVEYRFFRNSPRDPDNLVAWYKSFLDGIVDAGVLFGDSTITLPPVRQVTGHRDQCVVFTIRPQVEAAAKINCVRGNDMCQECVFEGRSIANVGEWRDAFGEPVVDEAYQDRTITDDHCLCAIDVPLSAKAAGLSVKGSSGEGFILSRSGLDESLRPILREWLANTMSAISEDGMCAGWLVGLEYELWELCQEPFIDRNWGQTTIPGDWLRSMRKVADLLGEWCVWDDETWHKFVPLDQWLEMLETRKD